MPLEEYDPNFKTSNSLIEVDGREPLQIERDYLDGLVSWEEVLEERKKIGMEVDLKSTHRGLKLKGW